MKFDFKHFPVAVTDSGLWNGLIYSFVPLRAWLNCKSPGSFKFDKKRKFTSPSGFTLVEILLTVGIMGILGTTAILSAQRILPGMRADRASSRMAFQLQLARSEAIANSQTVFVSFSPDANQLTVWVDRNRDGVRTDDEVTTVDLGRPGLVEIESDWEEGMFNAFGQFVTTPGQREMRTVGTRFHGGGSGRKVELILRGSGAITKR